VAQVEETLNVVPNRNKDFGYLKILDLYSSEELEDIWREVSYLDYIMDTSDVETHRGVFKDGTSKMNGHGVFIDNVYTSRDFSSILKYNRKLFIDEDVLRGIDETNPANKASYPQINRDTTLLNRYRNSHKYSPHNDLSLFTAITVLLNDEENISGGEFIFSDYDISFECVNNSCVIFPSWVNHGVNELECAENSCRYSIAQLMYISPTNLND